MPRVRVKLKSRSHVAVVMHSVQAILACTVHNALSNQTLEQTEHVT